MRCSKCGLIYDDTYGSNTCSCGGEIVSDRDYRAIRNTVRVSEETERPVSAESARSNSKRKVNKKVIVLAVSIAVLAVALVSGVLLWQSSFAEIPDVIDQKREDAVQAIIDAGFDEESVEIAKEYNDEVKKGYVIQQNKTGRAFRSSKITLTISRGPDLVTVPDMTGWSKKKVKTELNGKLKYEIGESVYSSTVKEGLVAKQSISEKDKVSRNTLITVNLSKGPKPIVILDLYGKSKEEVDSLYKDKLTINYDYSGFSDTIAKECVVGQKPKKGTAVSEGSEITVQLSRGPEPTTVSSTETITSSVSSSESISSTSNQVSVSSTSKTGSEIEDYDPSIDSGYGDYDPGAEDE